MFSAMDALLDATYKTCLRRWPAAGKQFVVNIPDDSMLMLRRPETDDESAALADGLVSVHCLSLYYRCLSRPFCDLSLLFTDLSLPSHRISSSC